MKVVHPRTGASFEAPDDWEVVHPDESGVASILMAVLEPAHEELTFRANLVLTSVPNEGITYAEWQTGSEELLPAQLQDYVLLDREECEVAGHPGGRRLAHHTVENGDAVVMEQWFVLVEDIGYTLTATVDSLRYDAAADDLGACGRSLQVPGNVDARPPGGQR